METMPLWHGAKEESVQKITCSKFDRGLAGDANGKCRHICGHFYTHVRLLLLSILFYSSHSSKTVHIIIRTVMNLRTTVVIG